MNKLLPLLAFSILLLVPVGAQNSFAGSSASPTITVNTDKPCYVDGDSVIISGIVSTIIPSFPIILQVISANGNLIIISQNSVNPDKTFELDLATGGPLWSSEGTYVVKVSYGGAEAENSFEFFFDECPILVGGENLPIETISLILAGAQSFSWMIPLVLSGIGIGIFVARKR